MHSGRFILALQSCNTTMIIVIFLCLFFFQYAHSIDYTYTCGWFIITSASRPYVCLSVCLHDYLLCIRAVENTALYFAWNFYHVITH